MYGRTFPGLHALRLALLAPDEDDGSEFEEQPGDREPDPEAGGEGDGDGGDDGVSSGDAEGGGDAEGDGDAGGSEGDGEGDGGAEGGDGGAEGAGAEGAEPPKPKTNWKDRQIIKLRQQMKDQAAELERLRGAGDTQTGGDTAAAGGGDTVGGAGGTDLVPREQAKREALQEFQQQQRVQGLNAALDAMDTAGKKAFPDKWDTQIAEAAEALGPEMAARPDFLEALTGLSNAAQVYHELSGDLDRLEQVLAMSPVKMGMELAALSGRLATPPKPKPVSRAPAPIPALDTHSADELSLDDPNISQDEFNRRMDKLEEQKYAQRR